MDSRIINQKAEQYKDRLIRLTPTLIPHLGLIKKSIYLRIGDYSIACVPFDLSLSKAGLVAILSEKESDFFKTFPNKPYRLFMALVTPYSAKPIDFFLLGKDVSFRIQNPSSPYCLIDLNLIPASIPLVYKEFIVTYFLDLEESERFLNDAPDEALSEEQIINVLGSTHVCIIGDNDSTNRLKITRMSPKSMTLFGEFEPPLPTIGETINLEPFEGNNECIIEAECTRVIPSKEAPGFLTVETNMMFCPYMVKRIQEAVGWTATKKTKNG